jgi:3-dehydroquinate synthetase
MASTLYRNVRADRAKSYCVGLCPGMSSGSISELASAVGSRKSLFVTTPTVARLYGNTIVNRLLESHIDVSMVVIPCSEESKVLSQVEKLCHDCFTADLNRTSVLIGCGGGVCTDLVTMAAALTRRGLNYIRIPTTLVGQIDASLGIKGAVNLPGKKSAIGCFHPPEQVFLEPGFLRTLPKRFMADGLSEAIKVAVIMDASLFEMLERYSRDFLERTATLEVDKIAQIVWRTTVTLLDDLEPNIYEDKSYRRLLDFGHSFSPLIESESHFRLSHGTAVSLDMAVSVVLAFELGLLSAADRDRILTLLVNSGLPIYSRLLTTESGCKALAATEAQRGGHLNLVLPTGVGSATFVAEKGRVPAQLLRRALDFLQQRSVSPSLMAPVISTLDVASTPGKCNPPGQSILGATGT